MTENTTQTKLTDLNIKLTHYCRFPDRTKVILDELEPSLTRSSRTKVKWTSKEGLTTTAWIPTDWIGLQK